MKKIVLILLALLPAMMVQAQDTVQSPFRSCYYSVSIPNFSNKYIGWAPQSGDGCGIITKEIVSKDPLKIYGLAACMMTEKDAYTPLEGGWAEFWERFDDTTTTECYEYLGVYLANADSLVLQKEVLLHRMYDPPAYYVETGRRMHNNPNFVYPMYEKYFDSAITVRDTFYVGTTERSELNPLGVRVMDHMSLGLMCISGTGVNEYHVHKYCWPSEGSVHWIWPPRESHNYEFYLIFPILTPDPDRPEDTTMVGDDTTTAVSQVDMMARYVTLHPNPAVDEARVLSSFGLIQIEAFDAAGRRFMTLPATGYEATLDISSWPRGTYLLRITTPLGTVTKKLLVQ